MAYSQNSIHFSFCRDRERKVSSRYRRAQQILHIRGLIELIHFQRDKSVIHVRCNSPKIKYFQIYLPILVISNLFPHKRQFMWHFFVTATNINSDIQVGIKLF